MKHQMITTIFLFLMVASVSNAQKSEITLSGIGKERFIFLASDKSLFVTGAKLEMDRGLLK